MKHFLMSMRSFLRNQFVNINRLLHVAAIAVTYIASGPSFSATATSTALTASVNPSYVGQSVALVATVTGGSPTGTVTFKNATTTLGTGTLSSGKATYNATFSTAGNLSLTATYAGNATYGASTSPVLTQVVKAKNTSTTSITSGANPTVVGQFVALSANVTGANPSGTVTFKDGTTTLGSATVSSGIATYSAKFSTSGVHSLTATYAGDFANSPSTSTSLNESVGPKTTSTTSLTSGLNPSYVNQGVLLTATVSGTNPTGTVTFKDGTTTLGSGTLLSGKASYTATFATAAAHSLTATYGGDASNVTSVSSAVNQVVQAKVLSKITLTTGANPIVVGQPVTITASVTGNNPTGSVAFKDGATTLSTVTLASGSATYTATFSTTGSHSLTAVYGGDVVNNTSTSPAVAQTVSAKTTSATSLTSSSNPAFVSQAVVLTATISGTNPTGNVSFKDGTTILGTSTVTSGKAVYSASFSTTGSHSLTAVYAGDGINASSTSTALTETIKSRYTSATKLTSDLNPSNTGQQVTLTATVSGNNPTGTVSFMDASTPIGSANISGGAAVLVAVFSNGGQHNLTASYSGDNANVASNATLAQTVVQKGETQTYLIVNPSAVASGKPVSFAATVVGDNNPMGSVSYLVNGSLWDVSPLANGHASTTMYFNSEGTYVLSASYSGDQVNNESTSAPVTIKVVSGSGTIPGPMSWQYKYDAQGNIVNEINPTGMVTEQLPDALGRVQKITLPSPTTNADRPVISYTFDGQNRLLSLTDARGVKTVYTRTGLNDYAQDSRDTGKLATASNENGARLYSTNARNQSISVGAFDSLNRPLSVDYINKNSSIRTGRSVLAYDAFSRTTGIENFGVGRLTSVIDYGIGDSVVDSVSIRYDQQGRVTWRCQFFAGLSAGSASSCANSDAIQYSWASDSGVDAGRLKGIIYPSGRKVNYAYDAIGRVSAISTIDPNGSNSRLVVSNAQYAPLMVGLDGSVLKGWTFGDGLASPVQTYARQFNAYGQIVNFTLGAGALGLSQSQSSYAIKRDSVGRVYEIDGVDSGGVAQLAAFGYDNLDRLTQASLAGGVYYNYDYDENDNRILKTSGRVTTTYTYPSAATDASNQLATIKIGVNGAQQAVATDLTGNVTQDPASPAGLVNYVYDDRSNIPYGRMVRSQGPGAQWDYIHNFFGQRIRKFGSPLAVGLATLQPSIYIGSADTIFYYDESGHLIAEMDGSASLAVTPRPVKREYIWAGDTLVAIVAGAVPGSVLSSNNSAQIYYVHSDHLNTPRLVTDFSGNKRWSWDPLVNEVFGATSPTEAPTAQLAAFTFNLRFPGQYLDKETGSLYNYFRTYNPSTGRYLQSDPIGLAGGLNTYAYVGGNPVSAIDPSGLARIVSPGFNSFADEVKWRKKYKDLFAINQIVRDKIAKSCPQLLNKFDQWVIRMDPNIDNMAKRARGTYMTTSYSEQSSQVNKGFFDITSGESPSQLFVFSHEFRHLLKTNDDLFRPGDEFRDPQTVPGEIDADAWARNFLGDRCTCEK